MNEEHLFNTNYVTGSVIYFSLHVILFHPATLVKNDNGITFQKL